MQRFSPGAEFVLGTAQLGSNYGRTNVVGHMSDRAALGLLEAAYDNGVRDIDTARAYGQSEQRIGDFVRAHGVRDLRILTKLDPLADMPADADERTVEAAVRRSVETSLHNLGVHRLPALMLHRAIHVEAFGGAVMRALQRWRDRGVIGEIGASVNDPEELVRVSGNRDIRHVQLPCNLLDHRWDAISKGSAGPRIHARSAFLQGLLATSDSADWPAVPGYDAHALVKSLVDSARWFKRSNVRELAIAYVRGQPWIHGCVVGLERSDQLEENLALFFQPALTADQCAELRERLPAIPEALIKPWAWPPR